MAHTEVRLTKVPAALWQRVRVAAAERGIKMRAFVLEAIDEHLRRNGR